MTILGILLMIIMAMAAMIISLYAYAYLHYPREKDMLFSETLRTLIVINIALIFFLVFLIPIDILAQGTE